MPLNVREHYLIGATVTIYTFDCVEVVLTDTEVLVRNSNRPGAGTLSFTFAE